MDRCGLSQDSVSTGFAARQRFAGGLICLSLFPFSLAARMTASGPACVKTPTNRVFMGTKMSPRATIVDSRAFCKADVSIELSKFEFSRSLGR